MKDALKAELEKLHASLADTLGMDRSLLRFEYTEDGEKTVLRLITENPRHRQSFLFHTTQGFGEMDALSKMADYIHEHNPESETYTIQWAVKDSGNLHTSYFRGKQMYEVLDKFYYGKDMAGTTIFSILLNPIS